MTCDTEIKNFQNGPPIPITDLKEGVLAILQFLPGIADYLSPFFVPFNLYDLISTGSEKVNQQ